MRPARRLSCAGVVALAAAFVLPAVASAGTTCHGQRATIVGTERADRLEGTLGSDVIVGFGGDDHINGLRADDVICGGAGRDSIRSGLGADFVLGGRDAGRAVRIRRGDGSAGRYAAWE